MSIRVALKCDTCGRESDESPNALEQVVNPTFWSMVTLEIRHQGFVKRFHVCKTMLQFGQAENSECFKKLLQKLLDKSGYG